MEISVKKIGDVKYGYAKILLLGESGSGKTYFASTYNPEKILFINIKAESGAMTLRALGVKRPEVLNIDTIEVDTYGDMKNAIEWIKNNGSKYEVIYIDSLSQWHKRIEKDIPKTSNGYASWATLAEYTKEIVDIFKSLPFHVVFTCEIVPEKDNVTGEMIYLPNLYGQTAKAIKGWFDEVYLLAAFQERLGSPISYKMMTSAAMKNPSKSRMASSGLVPMVISDPNLSELINITTFKKIDKKEQEKELKSVSETNSFISDANLKILRELLERKDVDVTKFLNHYGAPHLPGFPDNKVADAIQKLNKCKDRPVRTAPKPAQKPAPKPANKPAQKQKSKGDFLGNSPLAGATGWPTEIEGAH